MPELSLAAIQRRITSVMTREDDGLRKQAEALFNQYSRSPKPAESPQLKINILVNVLLQTMALCFNHREKYNRWLTSTDGWINFSVGIRSRDNSVKQSVRFENGQVTAHWGIDQPVDTCLVFRTPETILEMLKVTPDEAMNMLVENRMNVEGNLAYMNLFNFYLNLLLGQSQQKQIDKRIAENKQRKQQQALSSNRALKEDVTCRQKSCIPCRSVDSGVKYLNDPFLPEFTLDSFPRLKEFHRIAFSTKPKICHERPKLLTDWHVEHGFEVDRDGNLWNSELRQAFAFRYLMENRKPIVWKDDLLIGTHGTSRITPLAYPDAAATTMWGELISCKHREIIPYDISDESIEIYHHHIFPYWAKRNIREWVRQEFKNPLCERIDEHLAAYVVWKTIGMSETIPDFQAVLAKGTDGLIQLLQQKLDSEELTDTETQATLRAMIISLEGVNAYARNLADETLSQFHHESNAERKIELKNLHSILTAVPFKPASTLHEAVQSIWIVKIALNMENSNDGTGFGRLDQLLQSYFEQDIRKLKSKRSRQDYLQKAIELIGCLFLKVTDHATLNPDIANHLFGGSPPSQTITIGGVTPEGDDAVNDMSYVILKVTEMLALNDPNVNARYYAGKNSEEFLRRCNDVNYITGATPAIHNDISMINALTPHGYAIEDIRDWSATGCVEPTLSGKHAGHTSAINISIVTALEMTLNNGHHPLMGWDLGPQTGSINNNSFNTFDDFFAAFSEQFKFLIFKSIEYNNMCGLIYQKYRPSSLMSVFTQGCIEHGRTVVKGGAKYNSTGATCIGLADVTDSLMAIKKLVFDEKKISFEDLKNAIDKNFEGYDAIHAMVTHQVPFFGSGNHEAVAMANRVAKLAHDSYMSQKNYRGGDHHTGFWSMSSHAAYGRLSGALPSGRLAGKPFTPGLTPEPNASKSLLDNLRDVAELDPTNLDNNIAFNVKVVPAAGESHESIVDNLYAYTKGYFDMGGTQMQMNVISSDMMRDAMAHPEDYRQLLVRISGYCAYFTQLDEHAQLELIERAEYGM